jgi:hypothetical protein
VADVYGAVVLSMSEGCKVDEPKLLSRLRDLRWSNDGSDWSIEDNQYFVYNHGAQYPTVRPERAVTLHYEDSDGNIQTVPVSEATDEQREAEVGTDDEQMTLAALSAHFNDCILSGSITIAATSNEKCRYVDFESITINSDLSVSYVLHHISTSHGQQNTMEEYSLGD